jgi:hypothetical protein
MKSRIPRKQKKRLSKANPIILVNYINIGNLSNEDVREYMYEIIKELKVSKEKGGDNIIQYFIPVRNQESKVECINPVLVNNELYQQAKVQLEEARKALDELLIK